ncbi:hypothetical protein OUZ56_026693 [Daphnia magna]|uniref:Uncharacterized protein n=1 Tax=Daphnia magna TaxID=35525 RepID=A0ABQ9ZNA9_9CRUS|nr:hypothetical protein OUZ56_026693 [Daphnia magna]
MKPIGLTVNISLHDRCTPTKTKSANVWVNKQLAINKGNLVDQPALPPFNNDELAFVKNSNNTLDNDDAVT